VNNLVEVVRDIRSSFGYVSGEFKTFALDCGSPEFVKLLQNYDYDYVFNLSALKHVRSEKDPFTMSRMVKVNIINTLNIYASLKESDSLKKYFCVSTDKAANPANFMGASKRLMEKVLFTESSRSQPVSLARFANVAFSDGSLLKSFEMRIEKKQPLVAPIDIERYFINQKESGELCLLSGLLASNNEIIFPKISDAISLVNLAEVAKSYLHMRGFKPLLVDSEDEARSIKINGNNSKEWPCFFFQSDTSGEKSFEEFFTKNEDVDLNRFHSLGVIKQTNFESTSFNEFITEYDKLSEKNDPSKSDFILLLQSFVPEFLHNEKGKNLDDKM